MKHSKIIIAAFILLSCAISSCRKDNTYMSDAIITGSDMRYCACCGGLMITFDGDAKPYSGDFKLISNISATGNQFKQQFPVYVKVNWTEDTTNNICHRITITKIAYR